MQKQSHSQFGGSIIEILSVLAIIGILSVAGITGYKYAMDKTKANQIVKDVSLGSIIMTNKTTLPENEEVNLGFHPTSKLKTKGARSGGLNFITIYNITKGVCEKLIPYKNNNEIKEIYTIRTGFTGEDWEKNWESIVPLTKCQETQTLMFLSTIPANVNGCWGVLLACQEWCKEQGAENCQQNSCINHSCKGPYNTLTDMAPAHGALNGRCIDVQTWQWRNGQYFYDGYIRYYNPKNQKWEYFRGTGRSPWCG